MLDCLEEEAEDGLMKADIVLMPPDDGNESAEDSGDEDQCGNVNNLSGKQLVAQAEGTFQKKGFRVEVNPGHNDNALASTARANERERKWVKKDLVSNFTSDFTPPTKFSEVPSDPVSCFELFLDDEVWNFLSEMCKIYATKDKGNHNFDISVSDLKCFSAILYLSGYVRVPRWRMFWEVGSESYNESVAKAMRRNRFEQIKQNIHCSDNEKLKPNDKFAKVRPLIDLLNKRFLTYASMNQEMSIDESMLPYYGKHGAKQFLKGKPIRFGYKMWCLCEPFGYLIQCDPYQGRQENSYKELGIGASTVLGLVDRLPKKTKFKIYADRFFSSIQLVDELNKRCIGFTGTIMKNRLKNCPVKETSKKMRGSYEFVTDDKNECTVTSWHDNRVVLMISNSDPVFPIRNCSRWISNEKKKMTIDQPNVIAQYNKNMGGVDRMDQNIENLRIGIRSKKWWWPVFSFCLESAMHNAWQLYRRSHQNKEMDYLSFRRNVVQIYLQKYGTPPSTGGRPKTSKPLQSRVFDQIRYDRTDHWIVQAQKQNRCALCQKNTTKMCEKCNVNLHDVCFKSYHIHT